MNRLIFYIRGYIQVEISGTGLDLLLNRLIRSHTPFWGMTRVDDFKARIKVFACDLEKVRSAAHTSMCEITFEQRQGIREYFSGFFHRPVFLLGVGFSIVIILFLQNFLLFYHVEGNQTVPDDQIFRTLEELGIGFGVYGPDIKPKWIKDHVLNTLPQLQWITVTQNGCMAKIVVRERPQTPQTLDRNGFANVIAARSGMITEQSVLEGQALKAPGDIVLAGDMLVSGVVDLETKFTVVYAQAEVYARTWYEKTVVTPMKCMIKDLHDNDNLCIWLEIGKRRIKIFGNSGISDTACDKMINRAILTLPGDLTLPVALMIETFVPYDLSEGTINQQQAEWELETYAADSVCADLCAGEILEQRSTLTSVSECYRLNTVFECHEMIAETVEGKWNEEDFQND